MAKHKKDYDKEEIEIKDPHKFQEEIAKLNLDKKPTKGSPRWIFRAENYFPASKSLLTKIQMAFDQFGIQDKDKPNTEKDLIREFQRKLHLYTNNLPERNDITQWLALMQHYGAPTRMLDWTYSFWVAVFFAIARKSIDDPTVIWALNTNAKVIKDLLAATKRKEDKKIKKIIKQDKSLTYCDKTLTKDCASIFSILKKNYDGFYIKNPFRLNDRLTIQQGVFLIPCNIKKSLRDNINVPKLLKQNIMKKYKLIITKDFQGYLLNCLRQMNFNNAVLFPGLQGFAESLWMRAGRTMEDKLNNEEIKNKLQLYTD